MACNTTAVANTDIDGIGIRASIYMQALFAFVAPAICMFLPLGPGATSKERTSTMRKVLKMNSTAVITTGCALLAAAFIQGARGSLDVYDAIIVLQLSWMNSLTAAFPSILLIFGRARWRRFVRQDRSDWHHANWRQFLRVGWKQLGTRGWKHFGFYSLHCTLTGIFGLWLFHDIRSWSPGCAEDFYLVLCGRLVEASDPGIRIAVLVVSSIAVVPVLNGLVFGSSLVALNSWTIDFRQLVLALVWLVPNILLIVATEQFISYNSDAIEGASDQSDWAFGQVLALIMVFPSLFVLISPVPEAIFAAIERWDNRRADREAAAMNSTVPTDLPTVPQDTNQLPSQDLDPEAEQKGESEEVAEV